MARNEIPYLIPRKRDLLWWLIIYGFALWGAMDVVSNYIFK